MPDIILDVLFFGMCTAMIVGIATVGVAWNEFWRKRQIGNSAGRYHPKPTRRKKK